MSTRFHTLLAVGLGVLILAAVALTAGAPEARTVIVPDASAQRVR